MNTLLNTEPDRATLWSLVIWLVLCALIAIEHIGLRKVLNHQGLAAWAQAFGSIVAIGVAIWTVSRQQATAADEKRLKMLDELARRAAIASMCAESMALYTGTYDGAAFDDVIAQQHKIRIRGTVFDRVEAFSKELETFSAKEMAVLEELQLREKICAGFRLNRVHLESGINAKPELGAELHIGVFRLECQQAARHWKALLDWISAGKRGLPQELGG